MRKTDELNKWHKGFFDNEDGLGVPQVIKDDIEKRGWVYRWLSTAKTLKAGGTDARGYIPYRVPDELRIDLKPGVYAEDYQVASDGLLHRGDLVLGVQPRARRDARLAFLKDRSKVDRTTLESITDRNPGLSVEEAKFENVVVKSKRKEETE